MTDETRNYRETLHLPQTDFPMKAGLSTSEPKILAHWQKLKLYERLRQQSAAREKYILHDGPPYANGDLHIGHALNKILKDIITRAQQMMGKNAIYVPGWDCHGLPIEWKIEEKYRAAGKDKDNVPIIEFRAECRKFADKWMAIQSEQFQRFGVIGDWANPYTTMDFAAEAAIVAEFQKFIINGSLYRGAKPVMWSVVEKTALAEAEVEYEDHVSPTIFVKFKIKTTTDKALDKILSTAGDKVSLVIWTTTPWTIPGNRAVAYSKQLSYGLYRANGELLIFCDKLAEQAMVAAGIEDYSREADIDMQQIATCAHPFAGEGQKHSAGYDFDVQVLPADFVTDEAGTGLVHVAPGHGPDDYELGLKHGLEIPFMVDEVGRFYPHVPLFADKIIYDEKGKRGNANPAVIEALEQTNKLFAKGKLQHQYPHSWRSKAPLIFRNTPQWFISMQSNNLREIALREIDKTNWVPKSGRNRIRAMIENRPDWVISRQRAWGVPLTVFVHKESGDILRDETVNRHIVEAVKQHGADIWFEADPQTFLGSKYKAEEYEQITDILDVWFDSGSTHAFVLEARAELQSPADLYLEGSDQHRGWFHSSLLESCGTRGRAPYKAVLTHGFVVDEKGRKMSKSAGNAANPQKLAQQAGADIIRLWVVSSDYAEDLRIGAEIIKSNTDAYRKMRNTFRFILGNLAGFTEKERIAPSAMPELERLMLHKLAMLDILVRENYHDFNFRKIYQTLFNFMTLDLSAFYFDIRKDALYCDKVASLNRRATRSVLDALFSCLTAWLAPILCFTMEEVWQARFANENDSVHLRPFPDIPKRWRDDELAAKWEKIRDIRRVVTGALEIERREKRIGSSLEAAPQVYIADAGLCALLNGLDMADICITSQIDIINDKPPAGAFTLDDVALVGVVPALAEGKKCQRSWKISLDVGSNPAYPDLSPRDAEAVAEFDTRAGTDERADK